MAELNSLFQIGLNVSERLCLVIGGGEEAEDKAGRLIDAGGRVTLVSPEVTDLLAQWASQDRLQWHDRGYQPADLDDGVFLLMNTLRGEPRLSEEVFAAAEARGILVNTYDDLVHSHFGMAALVRAGPLRISISTSNASPTLSGRLRRDLEDLFDTEFGDYLEALGQARALLKEQVPDFASRCEILHSLVEGAHLEGRFHLPEDWRRRIEAAVCTNKNE
jgi:precorrin-2 dehydrogenase/sirohydrochlorin ferrochelatase